MGIRHRTTVLYHPQSNLSERVNRTLKPMLAIFAEHDKESWDIRLLQLALAIRAAINEYTGHSPAFFRAYTERLKAILVSAHQSARENLEIAQQGQKLL
ncbi:unnamed protein product [Didymodactylos carnosus]|uniref:Integrase catalytic domain-containing protein n=1 Tax=Didymodactylos carnosus TaxID=1234261 RepID=A0A8S2FSZ9_9BILA|nr:unnamed protein product [Didymodactylos carnosus]CAF4344880.1 unnamed protein product [Didymodactylos carnosus]